MDKRFISKKLSIGASSILLVGLAVGVGCCRARQIGDLDLPNAPMGYLGIFTQEVNADRAKELKLRATRGVVLTDVIADGPAAKTGMKKGDVVTEYNGQVVEGILQLGRLVRETPPGHTAQILVWRDGHAQKFTVELGEARAPLGGAGPGPLPQRPQFRGPPGLGATIALGISAQGLSGQLGSYFGAPNSEGVLVTNVQKDSAGEKAGLKAGDVITKVDGQTIRNLADLRDDLSENRSATSITLGVLRNAKEISMTAQLAGPNHDHAKIGNKLIYDLFVP